MPEPKFRVAIVGGGIGGLALALAICRETADIDVDVYESAPAFSDVGAGLVLWPRIIEIMLQWGLKKELEQYLSPAPGGSKDKRMKYFKGDQADIIHYGMSDNDVNGMHRAEFLKIFVGFVTQTRCKTHFNKKFVTYESSGDGQVELRFADGSSAACDIMIGADGGRSTVRRVMYTKFELRALDAGKPTEEAEKFRFYIPPKWSGELLYRSIVKREDLVAANPHHISLQSSLYFTGKNKFLMSYPVSAGRMLNTAAIITRHEFTGTTYEGPWSAEVSTDELLGEVKGWAEEAQDLVLNMSNITRWVVNYTEPLPTYIDGRVALLGDSAHAMVTHQASGAGQTIEDAYVLGPLLAHPQVTKSNLPIVLAVYDAYRRPRAQNIQAKSLTTGKMIMFETLEEYSAEDSAKGLIPLDVLRKQHEQVQATYHWVRTPPEADKRETIRILEQRLASVEQLGA